MSSILPVQESTEVPMSNTNYDHLKLENQLCFPLYAASREVIKQYRPYLDEIDLTYTQYITLMVIWAEETISVKELGKRLFLDSGTLTPVLKSLEAKGFITRKRSTEDERVLMIELTEAGGALKEQAAEIPQRMASCIPLAAEDAAELYRLLHIILENSR